MEFKMLHNSFISHTRMLIDNGNFTWWKQCRQLNNINSNLCYQLISLCILKITSIVGSKTMTMSIKIKHLFCDVWNQENSIHSCMHTREMHENKRGIKRIFSTSALCLSEIFIISESPLNNGTKICQKLIWICAK